MGHSHPLNNAETMFELAAEHLPKTGSRILEVGCGSGHFAHLLETRGYKVTAIDPSAEAVASAKALGVAARQIDFLGFEGEGYDALVFTRSLHHIHPLDQAVEHAFSLLKHGGVLLSLDFDVRAMNAPTARWFYGLYKVLEAGDWAEFHDHSEPSEDPLETWDASHPEHHLSSGKKMITAVEKRFGKVESWKTPYLYRYFLSDLRESAGSLKVVEAILDWESRLIEAGEIAAMGLQFKAVKR